MKTLKQFFVLLLIALIALAVVGCKPDPDPVHEHQWGDWTVTKEPTATEEGEETKTCSTCGDKETRPIAKLIQREFTISGFAKPIIVKDMRTGKNDTDLETLGVVSRLTAGLNEQGGTEFDRAINLGLIIEVEDTTEYTRIRTRSGNRMGANITYVLSDDPDFVTRLDSVFATMSEKEPDSVQ